MSTAKETRPEVDRLRDENIILLKENADLKVKLEMFEMLEPPAPPTPPPPDSSQNSVSSKSKGNAVRRRFSSSFQKVVSVKPTRRLSKKPSSAEHDKSSLLHNPFSSSNVGGGGLEDDDDAGDPHIGNVMDILRQDYEQRLAEVTKERDELKAQLSTYKSQCTTLQTKVDKVEGEVGLVKFDLDAARLELVQKEDDVAHLVQGMQKDMSKALAKKDGALDELVQSVQLSVQDVYQECLRDAAFLDHLPEAYLVSEEAVMGTGNSNSATAGGKSNKDNNRHRDSRDKEGDDNRRRRSEAKGGQSSRKRGSRRRSSKPLQKM